MRPVLTLFVLVIAINQPCLSQNYNKKMVKSLKRALGRDVKKYQFFSYPTDNFGIYTLYDKRDNSQAADMWQCTNQSIPPVNDSIYAWLSLRGFTNPSHGGAISLKETTKKTFTLNASMPKFYEVLNIITSVTSNNTTYIDMTIDSAFKRFYDPVKLLNVVKANDYYKELLAKNLMKVTWADIVVKNLAVTVKVQDSIAVKLDAKMGATGSNIFQDASLNLGIQKVTDGTYKFIISHPVVLAVRVKQQNVSFAPHANDEILDVSSWDEVRLPFDPSNRK